MPTYCPGAFHADQHRGILQARRHLHRSRADAAPHLVAVRRRAALDRRRLVRRVAACCRLAASQDETAKSLRASDRRTADPRRDRWRFLSLRQRHGRGVAGDPAPRRGGTEANHQVAAGLDLWKDAAFACQGGHVLAARSLGAGVQDQREFPGRRGDRHRHRRLRRRRSGAVSPRPEPSVSEALSQGRRRNHRLSLRRAEALDLSASLWR